jgi:hypothetical protein
MENGVLVHGISFISFIFPCVHCTTYFLYSLVQRAENSLATPPVADLKITYNGPHHYRNKSFLLFYCPAYVHCNENPIYVFLVWELRGLSSNFHIYVSVSRIGRSIVGIYINRPQTHECRNWDCGCAIPCLGVFVSNFRYCVFAVYMRHTEEHAPS